jgi:hypothetical protein
MTAAGVVGRQRHAQLQHELDDDDLEAVEQAEAAGAQREVTLDVSLDAPVVPAPVSPLLVGTAAALLACVCVAVAARIPLLLAAIGRAAAGGWRTVAALAARANVGGAIGEARYALRLALGSVQAWLDDVRAAFDRAFGPEVRAVE